jgi:hypothetical protein
MTRLASTWGVPYRLSKTSRSLRPRAATATATPPHASPCLGCPPRLRKSGALHVLVGADRRAATVRQSFLASTPIHQAALGRSHFATDRVRGLDRGQLSAGSSLTKMVAQAAGAQARLNQPVRPPKPPQPPKPHKPHKPQKPQKPQKPNRMVLKPMAARSRIRCMRTRRETGWSRVGDKHPRRPEKKSRRGRHFACSTGQVQAPASGIRAALVTPVGQRCREDLAAARSGTVGGSRQTEAARADSSDRVAAEEGLPRQTVAGRTAPLVADSLARAPATCPSMQAGPQFDRARRPIYGRAWRQSWLAARPPGGHPAGP